NACICSVIYSTAAGFRPPLPCWRIERKPSMSTQQIARNFGRSASHYDAHAQVQFQCASKLLAYMEANTRDLVDGAVLEVGCGTGIVSRGIAELFPDRALEITDICDEMVARCKMRLEASGVVPWSAGVPPAEAGLRPHVRYSTVNIQSFQPDTRHAMVVAAFVLQWVEQLSTALTNVETALKPGGKLFFSVPTDGSFPEWKTICKRAGVAYTGNALPGVAEFRSFAADAGLRLSVYEETFPVHHQSLQQFLISLKSIGAGTSLSPARLTI